MLDLASLKKQLNQLVARQREWQEKQRRQLEKALGSLEEFSTNWQDLADKIAAGKTSWLVAGLTEAPTKRYHLPTCSEALNVLSSDGSQIFPDRHQLAPCYLINIGLVAICYGSGQKPVLRNEPTLFSGENPWKPGAAANSEDISAYRNLLELQGLSKLADEAAKSPAATLALSDGTLIWWFLEGKSQEMRQEFLEQVLRELDKFRQLEIPIAGYISRPGSSDVVKALRVGLCPQELVDCDYCPFDKDALPCAVIEMVLDRALFAQLLEPGERSATFKSASQILSKYGEHYIHFFYLHSGYEIVRVEIPQWVGDNPEYLDLTHSTLYDQAQKGLGYPVVLTEAHQQAVVKGAERNLFYQLLEGEFARHNLRINTSRKLSAKTRVPI